MKHTRIFVALALTLALLVPAGKAAAWGDTAQRTAAAMAMQVIKGPYPGVFRPGEHSFEQDVFKGAADGVAVLESSTPLMSDAETVQAIGNEIQLLRDAQAYGRGPYFAYRMGVLSALVADVMIPYGFAWTPAERAIQERIITDTEAHLSTYGYTMQQRNREFIRSPKNYFASHRSFYADDKRIITNDYRGGKGYNGFLRDGGPAYFSRAVDAIADAWHTVLRPEDDPAMLSASRSLLAAYFVDQIAYLLQDKRDFLASRRAYENFERVNLDLPESYERIGDLYYAFGTEESLTTAVREWRIAHDLGGPERHRVAQKLAGHYKNLGNEFLERAGSSIAEPDDLESALRNFEAMLEYDRTSADAAILIQETHIKIQERNERYELALNFISNAEVIEEQANAKKDAGDFSNAIGDYALAIGPLEAVDDEFKDLFKVAQDKIAVLNRNIRDTVSDIIEVASDAIDRGSRMREDNQYADAIAEFNKVPDVLVAIPDEGSDSAASASITKAQRDEKQEVLDLALRNIDEAKKAKIRYEQAQQSQQAGGGARPGAAPGAAPGG